MVLDPRGRCVAVVQASPQLRVPPFFSFNGPQRAKMVDFADFPLFSVVLSLGRVLNGHSGARSATARQSEKGDPSSRGQGPRAPHPGGLGSGVGTHAYNLIVHLSYFSMRSRTGVGINMRQIPQWILHTLGYNTTEGPPPLSLSV